MANWPPLLEKLSADRWEVVRIGEMGEQERLNGDQAVADGDFGPQLQVEGQEPGSVFANGYFEME